MDWDAIKLFLALYRAGSARAVAAELNTSASTVTRRISQLEASLDIKLFNRHSAGFKLTEYGHSLATGSANVYLMQYWQKILQKKYLAGRQLSKEGGLFYGKVFGHSVALRGRAEIAN